MNDKPFRELIGKVRPLTYDGIEPEPRRTPPRRRRQEVPTDGPALVADARPAIASDRYDTAVCGDYHRPGLQRAVLKKLKRGQFPVQDEIDLHGMTLKEAGELLGAFIEHARGQRFGCVRVIHGKGLSSPGRSPVLKPQVARWLRGHDGVLAYAAARDADGGSGAMFVLLRARRES